MSPTDYQRAFGAGQRGAVQAYSSFDLSNDRAWREWLGAGDASGMVVNAKTALRNPAVYRCVTLHSNVIGMLPFQAFRDTGGSPQRARGHPIEVLLGSKPNHWQTPFEFRRLMQHRVLTKGNAYALPIKSRGKLSELIPIDPDSVTVEQGHDFTVRYKVRRKSGDHAVYKAGELLHVMGPSEDGLTGIALAQVAGEAIGLALSAQRAAKRMFSKGVTAGGALESENKLTEEQLAELRRSLDANFSGEENAGRWMLLEQGLTAKPFGTSGKDAQNVEQRAHQIEEVARIFGTPRPFLMLDDTSWGSGIEQLGMFFVTYGLAPHFVAWEQAIARSLIGPGDEGLYLKFNERALLRGLIKDQGEFFARALGSGGHQPWMSVDEVRGLSELPPEGGSAARVAMAANAAGQEVS